MESLFSVAPLGASAPGPNKQEGSLSHHSPELVDVFLIGRFTPPASRRHAQSAQTPVLTGNAIEYRRTRLGDAFLAFLQSSFHLVHH